MSGHRSGARWPITIVLGTALLSAQGRVSPSAPGDEDIGGRRAARNRVIVKFRDAAAPSALAQIDRDTDADERRGIGGRAAFVIHSRSHGAAELVSMLARRADVEYAEPDYVAYQTAVPNDPFFGNQWALRNVGQTVNGITGTPGADVHAPAAWNIATGSTSTVVGITDGGFDDTVFDLVPNLWSMPADMPVTINGQTITCLAGTHGFKSVNGALYCDAVFSGDRPAAHATHVAGIVGAAGTNQQGVAGVNWQASLMSLNFFGASNSNWGYYSDAINVIEFAVQVKLKFGGAPGANVRVLNASWGGPSFSQALLDEIDRAGASDILFVAAAMNSSQNLDSTPEYPASYNRPNMLVVASTNSNDQLSGFSNYGPNTVHLAAPGENILSTLATGYGYMSGTSMATPLVAGAAALALSRCPLDTAGVKSLLLNSVDHLSQLAGKTMTGGRLNIANALQTCAAGAADAPPSVTLTAPVDATAYAEPASIALAASASDTDGTIARVEFYAGSTLIGTVTAPPYTATWSNVPAGMYVLTAVAVDNAGMQSSSHLARVSVTASGANGSLPQPWQHQDIGAVGTPGTASYTGPTFTVQGAGSGIGATSGDAFQYTYQSIADGEIVARVASTQNTASGARAGIVLRQDLSATSPNVLLAVQPDGNVVLSWRQYSGDDNVSIASATMSAPVWLKLTRRLSTVTGYVSADNVTWIRLGQTSLNDPPGYSGLAVTSGDIGQLNRSTFDHVAVVGGTAPRLPGMPNNPIPRDRATGVPASGVVPSWDASGATSYDVRFGTTNPPPLVSSGQTNSWYTPASVRDGTTYFWQIVAHNSAGATGGPIWSFSTVASSGGSLPSPWQNQDVGSPGLVGGAAYSSGAFTVSGAGADIWGTSDAFQFVYQPIAGDGQIVARVTSIHNTNAFAKAGIMLRETTAAGAAHVILDVKPDGSIEFMTRPTTGAATTYTAGARQPVPAWLKLSRSGATITASVSANGSSWTTVGNTTPSIASTALFGLAVTSHDTTQLNTSTFDNVTVGGGTSGQPPTAPDSPSPANGATGIATTPTLTWSATNATTYDVAFGTANPPPTLSTGQTNASYTPTTLANSTTYFWQVVAHNSAGATGGPIWSFSTVASSGGSLPSPWQHVDVGSTGLAGSAAYSNGTFSIGGAGADIWGSSDAFQFVYQTTSSDGQIIAHVSGITNTNTYAKAGVMWRDTTAAGAADVILDVRPSGDIEFMSRATNGGSTSYIAGATQVTWLKLTRSGPTFAGFVSTDGSSWTLVGTTTATMGTNAVVGLAVTSHDTTQLNTSTFDSVSISSAGAPPGAPASPSPGNGATSVSVSPTLTWSASGASSYDVHFGTASPPPAVSSGQSAASYTPGTLLNNTQYFWQVLARNTVGTTTGPVWSFTTATQAPQNVVIYANDIPPANLHGSWSPAGDSTAAAGVKLVTPDNGVSNTGGPVASPTDYVDVTFNAAAATPYTFWIRLQALNNSKYNDSIFVQFSDAQSGGSPIYPINTTSGLTVNLASDSTGASDQQWGWVDGVYWLSQAATVTFASGGAHTLRIQVREDGVQFDQIVLSPSQYLNAAASCPATCAGAPGPLSNDATIVPKP